MSGGELKLYCVEFSTVVYVVARTLSDAEREAGKHRRDEDGDISCSEELKPGSSVWSGYDNSIPWGEQDPEDPNRTVDGWLKHMALTEEERRKKAELDALQVKLRGAS